MKYLSVLAFALLLGWTWSVIHSDSSISYETHAGIQEKLSQLIKQSVMNKKPGASAVRIQKIWTEPKSKDEVQAHFVYSFQEPDSNGQMITSQISGDSLLQKQPDDGSGLDRWSLKDVKTTGDAVVFQEGLLVTPDQDPSPDSSATVPPAEEQKQ